VWVIPNGSKKKFAYSPISPFRGIREGNYFFCPDIPRIFFRSDDLFLEASK